MNKLHMCVLLSALIVASATTMAQLPTQTTTPQSPAPSTSPGEGTAADQTPPGETATRGTPRDVAQPAGPATSPTEGTAADRTPPARGEAGGTMQPELVGLQVVSPSNAPIGEVVDVVFDSQGRPDYVVIASQGDNAAVPFQTASSMMEGGKVIIDQSKLQQAPKLEQGEWREEGDNASWKQDATRYWDQG